MKIFSSILLSSLLLVAVSCNKEKLEPTTVEAPVFYLEGKLNGESFRYVLDSDPYFGDAYYNEKDSFSTFGFSINDINQPTRIFMEITINNREYPSGDIVADLKNTLRLGDFKYSVTFPPAIDKYQRSKVSINWYDQNAQSYSSVSANQDGSYFHITEIEDIIRDGEFYRKATIEFSCKAFSYYYYDTIEFEDVVGFIIFKAG